MPNTIWSDHFSIGIPQIDKHHQHLFWLLNRLYDELIRNVPTPYRHSLLDEYIDNATSHFAAEEYWMRESGFSDLEMHEHEHALFSRRVMRIDKVSICNQRQQLLLNDTLTFLRNWLQIHILQADAKFGRFLAADNNRILQNTGTTTMPRLGDVAWNG